MILPALLLPLVLGVVSASLCAALAALWRARSPRDLLTLWLAAQIGFWLAHLSASLLGGVPFSVGDLQLMAGVVGALTGIGVQILAVH